MNYYYITGASRGIGRALTELLLENGENFVYGLSRSSDLKHPRYKHIPLDLSEAEVFPGFSFPKPAAEISSVILVNNAGMLGDVAPVGKQDNDSIVRAFNVNSVAPAVLMNTFIKQFADLSVQKQILNVSSGAGRHTVESWSVYCAGKSALDMFSEVIDLEKKYYKHPFTVYSVAPGIVDTHMQDEIRAVPDANFEDVQRFRDYKANGDLSSPIAVARQLSDILEGKYPDLAVLADVRKL